MIKQKGIGLELVGYTTDKKMVVKNIYRFFETVGIDLADIFEWCHNNNCLPSWIHLYEEAKAAGMKHERILVRLENPIIDIWGKEYWFDVKQGLNSFASMDKNADQLYHGNNELIETVLDALERSVSTDDEINESCFLEQDFITATDHSSHWMTRERMTAIAQEAAKTEEMPSAGRGPSNKQLECLYCQERYSNTLDYTSNCVSCGSSQYALVKSDQPRLSIKDRQQQLHSKNKRVNHGNQ